MATISTKELTREFLDGIYDHPDGEKVNQCLQCGTCTASCPTSEVMDWSPRQIFAAVRAEMLDRVLGSNTDWYCVSCYSCTVRCPASIPITDVMYLLKNQGIKHNLMPRGTRGAKLSKAFCKIVSKGGRSAEFGLMMKYYFSTNPFAALGNLGFAMKMLGKGRLSLGSEKIKDVKGLRKMLEALEEISA
ncbi:4Fe-4S dicluster domain-containing protein [bacterium]|nr:4Fe-4S dicluster domain-containing protein [bacterium]